MLIAQPYAVWPSTEAVWPSTKTVRGSVMAADPWALPNLLVLLAILLLGIVAVANLIIYAVIVMARYGIRRSGAAGNARYLAALAAAVAIAMYAWGALHMLTDETGASQACQDAVGPANAGDVASYEISYVPLRFGCRVEGVGTYEALVPGYVNPAVLVMTVLTVYLVAVARSESRRRRAPDKVTPGPDPAPR